MLFHSQHSLGRRDIIGQGIQRKARRAQQSTDEPASGLVMATQHQKDREQSNDREQIAGGTAQDDRLHAVFPRAGRSFNSASTPNAATASTTISPSVSSARKSTRITLTILRPW